MRPCSSRSERIPQSPPPCWGESTRSSAGHRSGISRESTRRSPNCAARMERKARVKMRDEGLRFTDRDIDLLKYLAHVLPGPAPSLFREGGKAHRAKGLRKANE